MILLNWTLADDIIIKLGDQVWFFGSNVLVFLLVTIVVGMLAESVLLLLLVRRCLPLLLVQGQHATGVSLARSTAQEQGKTPTTEDTTPPISTLGLSPNSSRLGVVPHGTEAGEYSQASISSTVPTP